MRAGAKSEHINGVDRCQYCGSQHVGVRDSRDFPEGRRRRRVCDACGCSWTTVEITMEKLLGDRRTAMLEILDKVKKAALGSGLKGK